MPRVQVRLAQGVWGSVREATVSAADARGVFRPSRANGVLANSPACRGSSARCTASSDWLRRDSAAPGRSTAASRGRRGAAELSGRHRRRRTRVPASRRHGPRVGTLRASGRPRAAALAASCRPRRVRSPGRETWAPDRPGPSHETHGLFWHLLIRGENCAYGRPMPPQKKLRQLELAAGAPSRKGQRKPNPTGLGEHVTPGTSPPD